MKRTILWAGVLFAFAGHAFAAEPAAGSRIGLGQDAANEPAKIKNLRLTDPLVQQKYLNEPDMLRFLRATYSEACSRGLVVQAAKQIKFDLKRVYTPEQRETATRMLDSQRIWKMTSFEMESLYGNGYRNAANYCDCIMKEVPDADMVNPKKGLDVVEKLSKTTQQSCERIAKEQTERQVARLEGKKP